MPRLSNQRLNQLRAEVEAENPFPASLDEEEADEDFDDEDEDLDDEDEDDEE